MMVFQNFYLTTAAYETIPSVSQPFSYTHFWVWLMIVMLNYFGVNYLKSFCYYSGFVETSIFACLKMFLQCLLSFLMKSIKLFHFDSGF